MPIMNPRKRFPSVDVLDKDGEKPWVCLGWRQSLWTTYPDGWQFQLYAGNAAPDRATFWQAREPPAATP